MIDDAEVRRRAIAALQGLAVGDAMGAATEGYLPEEIEEVYDAPVGELIEPINLYPDATDDRQRAAVGPVTRIALAVLDALGNGDAPPLDPENLGWAVPLGIIAPAGPLDAVLQMAGRVSDVTSAACGAAIAAAVSAGTGGYLARDATAAAVRAAEEAGAPDLGQRIVRAAGAAQASGGRRVGAAIGVDFPPGPGVDDVTVFALGVVFGTQSVRRGIPEAVNQGRRSSLSAGLVGAICGAIAPATTVETWANEVEEASGIDLTTAVGRLLELRRRKLGTNGG